MSYTFNGSTKRITLSSGTTVVDLEDLYSRWKDWVLISDNSKYLPAFRSTGGEADGTGGYTGKYLFIGNGWSIIPQSANHTLVLNGNLFRDPDDTSGVPIISTVAGYTISVIFSRSSLAQGISTGGTLDGFNSSDRTKLTDLAAFKGLISGNPVTANPDTGIISTQDGKKIKVTGTTTKVYTRDDT